MNKSKSKILNNDKVSNRKISIIISLVYIGLGAIYSSIYWTGAIEIEGFGKFLFYFFLPGSSLSIAFIFTIRNPAVAILIGQLISFFIVWGPIHLIVLFVREIVLDKK